MTGLLEPHQNVRGADSDEPFLTSEAASDLVAHLAMHIYSASLVGNPAPKVAHLFDRMYHPEPGDLVVVQDSVHSRDADTRFKGVGRLVTMRKEWASSAAEWAAECAEDPGLGEDDRWIEDRAWYVQYGPSAVDVCRWRNCSVIAAPTAGDWWA
jgi:hypothetical protein